MRTPPKPSIAVHNTKRTRPLWLASAVVVTTYSLAAANDTSWVESKTAGADNTGRPSSVAVGENAATLDRAAWHVYQARNGDYWFGSQDQGAYRYRGTTLVHFTTKDGLTDNRLGLGGIREDASGNIYFNTATGISRFNGESFTTLRAEKSSSVQGGWALGPHDLWFAGPQDSGAIYRYDGRQLHRLKLPATREGDEHLRRMPRSTHPNARYSPYDVYRIYKDSKGNVWFGTSSLGACRYDGETFTWLPEQELRNGSFGTRAIVEDKDGRFWFCNSRNRYEIDLSNPAAPAFRRQAGLRVPNNPRNEELGGIMSSLVDRTGALWLATYETGVWRYDGMNVTCYPVNDGKTAITLFSIYEDRQGTIWLGTQESGALRLNGRTFEKFVP